MENSTKLVRVFGTASSISPVENRGPVYHMRAGVLIHS